MPFDDSLIGSNDFDPRTATEDLIRRVTPDAPATLEPRALTTRLARKLGHEPPPAPEPEAPKAQAKHDDLDFSSQALPAQNMEPGGKNDLDFTSQVQQPAPPVSGGIGGPTAFGKGLLTGAVEGAGGVMKGAARIGNQTAPYLESLDYDAFGNIVGQRPVQPAKPIEDNGLYQAGKAVEGYHPNMTPEERDSLTGRVGTMIGGIAPYGAAAIAGGPAVGIAAGFTGMAADTYGKVFEDAKAKGADDATATQAAGKAATAAGVLGSLPLGTGTLAKSIVGKVLSQGITFAGTNEATEYVLQEIAKDYDEKAGYTPEAKRIIASLITGGLLGGLHAFERKGPEHRQDTESDTSGREPPAGAIPSPEPDQGGPGPDAARARSEQEARDWQRRGWDDQAGQAGSGAGPQGGPQPGGAKAKPGAEQQPGEPPKGEGQDIPDDYTMDPKMRAKMERVFRTFDKTGNPSKMTDAELFRAVNEHLRDTSSTGYTAKEDTTAEKAQRDQHQAKQSEDAELKAAFPWMKDSQIASMTPDMREVWLGRARGAKPGAKATEGGDTTEQRGTAAKTGPDKVVETPETSTAPSKNATGTRETPIAAKTADDVLAAQPHEPKSAAQAEAENYKHAHMELEHLGLRGEHSISIETGVGQTRKGPPGPDGKPTWEVKMEQGAYGRIKGTKGADGQPLDIMVGPHPSSPHVFIINQHDPATGQFDELKVQAGYRTPLDAMHAYAKSFDDHARERIGGMVAMSQDQFRQWLKHGDHTKAVQHASNSASVLARAFPEAGGTAKSGAISGERGVESIAPSAGLHNAAEGARRPLTEAPAETSSPEVPKGSREGDAKEATARPADTTTQNREGFKAVGKPSENLSLLEFLADRGGIAPHPELEAIGFGGMHRVQVPGRKGFFGLIKKGGWDLDTAREAAEEMGYLQGSTPEETSTIRQLLDAMDAEARGTKLYPFQGEGQRTGAERRIDKERAAHEEEQHQRYYAQAHAEIDAEYPELPRDLRDTAARAIVLDGFDVDTAVEYAAIWEVNRDNELYEQPEHSILETFGPEAADAIQTAATHADGAQARGREEAEAGGSEARPGDGGDVQAARAEGGETGEDARGEAAGRPAEAAGAEPVREPARAVERAAGREQAAGDETGDAARHQPAAEAADDAEVAPRYDYDGASETVTAADSDESVTVTLSRQGPWDFSETFPAPIPEQLKALEDNGRWPFGNNPASIEEIASSTDAGVYDMMGEIGTMRAVDLQIEGIKSGKVKLKGKRKPETEIESLKQDRAKAADDLRQLQGVFEDIFGREASNAMVKEARRRLVSEETLEERSKPQKMGPVEIRAAIEAEAERLYPKTSESKTTGKGKKAKTETVSYVTPEYIAFVNGGDGLAWNMAQPIHITEEQVAAAYDAGQDFAIGKGFLPPSFKTDFPGRYGRFEQPKAEQPTPPAPSGGKAHKSVQRDRDAKRLNAKEEKREAEFKAQQEKAQKELDKKLKLLPDGLEAIIADYKATIDRFNDLMVKGTRNANLADRLDLLETKANGGTRFAVLTRESDAEKVRNAAAAPIGTAPKWGQRGVFTTTVDGINMIVTHEAGSGSAIYAIDKDKPFPSPTGYRSFAGGTGVEPLGKTVKQYWDEVIRKQIAAEGLSKHPPEVYYRLPEDYSDAGFPVRAGENEKPPAEPVKHGRNARRRGKDDPVSKYLKVNRPKANDDQGWISYRTEATLAYNTALDDNAAKAVLEVLKREVDTANDYLMTNKPDVWHDLTRPYRDAPTWAEILAELPMHKDGRTREHEIAFAIMKEIAPKAREKFDNLTPLQKMELLARLKDRNYNQAQNDFRDGKITEDELIAADNARLAARTVVDNEERRVLAAQAKPEPKPTVTIDRASAQLIITKLDTNAITLKEAKEGAKRLGAGDVPGRNKEDFIRNLGRLLPQPAPEPESRPVASWVIKDKATGAVVAETYDRKQVDALNTDKYEAVPIQKHLASLSAKPVTTETGADGKQQTVIPGAEKASDKTMAQRGAEAPLKPKANQKPADDGLFGDGHKQTDLLDTLAKKPAAAPRDEFDDIFDAAVNEQFAKPVSLDQATEGLKAIFGKKPPSGLAESEAPFSDDTYAQALPFLKAGTASFANAGDLTAMVRALVSHLANSGMDADAIRAMKPYIRRFTDDVRSGKETLNAPSRREVLERDRANAAPEDAVGAADVSAPAERAGRGTGARGAEAPAGDERPGGVERLPQDYAPVVGERGHLEIPEREPVADERDDAAPESDRGADGSQEGFSFDNRTDDQAETDAQRDADVNGRRERQRQADAKAIPLKHGDLENIAATLPMLFPEQHADVKAAEDRFAKPDGHGMLFTNGTGTGKTYSGLGIIKRFALAGKKQAIVIAPSQGILMDWQRSAKDLGLDMHILDSTVDKGRPGLNGTTYANFGDNAHIVDHDWDLIVPDEAHKLSSDQDGSVTKALSTLRALTMHPDGLHRRAEMVLRDLFEKIPPAMEKAPADYEVKRSAALKAYHDKSEPLIRSWQNAPRKNKAAFLSATPFAYHFSLDWANGYLFDYGNGNRQANGGYNSGSDRDRFYMQHLGYRMRTNKLTTPEAGVKQDVMERQLHEYLRKTGSLAGRMLTVDKDYDRKFVLAHDAVGNQIDQALKFLQDNEQFRPLVDYVAKRFDYLTRMRLLEAIKARAAINYINESLALGRKVVVFHDYNEGGGINPFDLVFSDDVKVPVYKNGKHEDVALKPLYDDFIRQNPYVQELKFSDYPAPIETLTSAFPKALVYNGTVPKKKRDQVKALFNDDNSGRDIIIVQSAAGEAGISLHDTTGKHQRVVLNLGMPIRPVSSIQQEGRIYRVGQASDALFRYMNTGTDWERWTFAGKIADRAGTAENLALGNQARTIRQSFIDAFANADEYRPEVGEGKGGKELDRAATHSMSEFEKAKTHYYAQAKVTGKRSQREGTDYYATAEPLGVKMVEWANVKSGEKMLEPSAGHGAIARYFPEDTHRTLVEPSSSLASRASLNSPGARVVVDRFENLDTAANKQDVIVMNPPFGSGGSTAIEHLAKAAKHLRNGGRIVALIPRGPSADAKFDKFMDSPAAKDIYTVATVNLPNVAFERAGTSIATRVVVLDKQTDPEVRNQLQQKHIDYSGEDTVEGMFDAIEHAEMMPRLEPKTPDVEPPAQGRITINGIEFMIEDDAKRSAQSKVAPSFYATPKNTFRDRFRDVVGYAEKAGGRYAKPSFIFPSAETRQAFLDMVANPPKAPEKPSGVTFKSGETVHGKTGKKVFVASPDQRVERAIYDQMNAAAKEAGGYYSSFTGRGAIPGFQFPSAEARAKFLAKMGSKVEEAAAPIQGDESADNFRAYAGDSNRPSGQAGQSYVLARGRATGNEQLVIFSKYGRAVGDEMGDRKSITFSVQLDKLVRMPGADLVLHHNHPSNRSFSPADIALLASHGINTIWAHGHGGNVSRAHLTERAATALPDDIEAGKDVLRVAYFRVENLLHGKAQNFINSIVDDDARADAIDVLNAAAGFIVNTVLAKAGIVEFETNFDIGPALKLVPGILNTMKQAEASAGRAVFNEYFNPNGTDRRARSVRHPGNMGVVFDRAELATPVGGSQRGNRARQAPDRGQEGGDVGDRLPGLEDLDRTFNDLLGKRLLGKLGDLNATEMRVQLQDKFARVRNVEQDKGNRDTALSAYQAESLYYGRTGQRLESLKEHVVDPIIREMKGRSIDLDTMDKFLYARHAPERNNVVGQLYPDGHDFKRATIDPRVKGASGMSTNEANSFIGRLRADGKLADYQAVARMVDALNFRTRQTLFNAGLIDRATFDGLNAQYRYYVPLRGWQEGSNEDTLPRQSKGMDTRAKAFKQAFGRQSLAASPLAYSIMQAEQAVVKSEKNKVGNTFLRFARANPDPDLWTINRPEPRKYVSKVTGMVHSSPTWDMNDPSTFVTRVDGKAVMIQFKGEDGGNLARALKNMGSANVHTAIRMMAAVTHTMARLATAWNPEFMIPNLVRDIGEAFVNLGEQRQRQFVRKFAGHILPAMKGSWLAIADKSRTPGSSAQAYIDAFHEFDREGGRVRFFGIDDPDVIEKNVEKRLKRLSGGVFNSVLDMGEKAGKALEIMGGGIENATRLAAYMAAKDVGMSAPDAAMLARNLTVNFNKKGELGTAIGSLYMFANAGVQGQARMLRALHPKNHRVWMAVGALVAAGILSTAFNLGIGGQDDAGQANLMKIPSWERDKNIIIMGPGETYGKIPLPYGFSPFAVLGSHMTTVLMGQEKPTAAAAAVLGSIGQAFNPLGEEDSLIATMIPTPLRPAYHITTNQNWTGKPLYPARDADKGKPESQQSFRTDTAASKFVAEKLNELTGGDRYRPGGIDIHPGSLDHVMGAITGGVGRFAKNVVDTILNGWNGQSWEASKTPIVRRFVGKIDHNMADSQAYYDARKEATEEANRLRQAKRDIKTGTHEQEGRAFLDESPAGRQKLIFDRADQQMRRLRAEEERVNSSAQPYDEKRKQLDALRQQMRDVQNRARAESSRLKEQRQ